MRAASLFLLFLPGKWHWAGGAPAWVRAGGWRPALVLWPELYPEPQGLLPLGPQTGLANPPKVWRHLRGASSTLRSSRLGPGTRSHAFPPTAWSSQEPMCRNGGP